MNKILPIAFLMFFICGLNAQTEKPTFGISFSGFLKTDAFYDTRQVVNLREGHFLLYPENESFDVNGTDINKNGSFNILSIQSRLTGKITGPNVLGATSSGVLEGEFFGTADGDANGFRLRHAYAKFDWSKVSLLVGQTWHPMFVTDVFPGVVSFNTGVPFQPFSRNPQIKLVLSESGFKFIFAAMAQRDFQSNGPAGFSSTYLRNAIIPNLHGQIQYDFSGAIFGAGADYKKLRPQLRTTKNISTDASVNSFAFTAFGKVKFEQFVLKSQGVYGNNLADMMMLGGYAVKTNDTASGLQEYTPINILSVWGEVIYGKELELAVFGGFSKALGASDNTAGIYYGRGTNIESIMRISPRVQYTSGGTRFALETEYTVANYGKNNSGDKGKVTDFKKLANLRVLFSVIYNF